MARRVRRFAVLLVFVSALPLLAWAGEYRLGPQDRLRIEVYEYPNLDGEHAVGASGFVPVPLIGEVPAEGSTPAELATAIAGRLGKAMHGSAGLSVTVEVVGYRPFYILGDVQNPGPYPFQPGLRMLQAVALAGGVYRLAEVGLLRISRDAIAAEGEIGLLEARQRELELERQRLEAEFRGDAELRFGEGDAGAVAAAALDRQRAVFATRRDAVDRQGGTLNALIGSLEEEVGSLDAQSELKRRQVDTVEQELATTRKLIGQGLTPTTRGLELERLAADIESDRQEVATARLRAQQALTRTRQSLLGLADDRRVDAATALEDLDQRLEETRTQLATQRSLLDEALRAAPALHRMDGSPIATSFVVTRFGGGATHAADAAENDPVEPGDVVTVRVHPAPESDPGQQAAR
ncbi:MAG: polysaccharide biosynthesis/export family protein [Amaricoccus sp.]